MNVRDISKNRSTKGRELLLSVLVHKLRNFIGIYVNAVEISNLRYCLVIED